MNFKTTLLLVIVLLVALAGYLFTTREEAKAPAKSDTQAKLVPIASTDIAKITITPGEGKTTTLEKTDGGEWKITAPVQARAEKWTVNDLVTSLTGLTSRGDTTVEEKDKVALGLDTPTKVALTGKDGKTVDLAFGSRSAVGDSTYVLSDGVKDKAKIVSAEVLEKLEDPARKYRDMRLTDVNSTDVKQVVVNRPEGTLKMEKQGENWVMTAPEKMPLESFEVTDIVSGVTNLRASEIVAEDAAGAAKYGLTQAKYVVEVSTAAPATQPSATAPAFTEIRLGSYDDIRKQNVFAMAGQNGPIAKVPAIVISQLTKKPLDLRDRKVVEIDPARVQSLAVKTETPATTQPATKPASSTSVKVARNVQADLQGPPAPASTQNTTGPATTQATTQESQPTWVTEGTKKAAPEDKIKDLLETLKTVRATKYLEKLPDGNVTARHELTVTTVAAGGKSQTYKLTIIDRGETNPPVGQYNGLTFEMDRDTLQKLKID